MSVNRVGGEGVDLLHWGHSSIPGPGDLEEDAQQSQEPGPLCSVCLSHLLPSVPSEAFFSLFPPHSFFPPL